MKLHLLGTASAVLAAAMIISVFPARVAAQDAPSDPVEPTETAVPSEETVEAPSEETVEEAPEGEDYKEPTKDEVALSDEQILYQEKTGMVEKRSTTDPTELPDEEYHFIGASFRNVMIPDFVIDLFADVRHEGEPWAWNPTVGLEYTYRTDGFSIVVNGLFSDFGGTGIFKPKGDPDNDTEVWESDIKMLWLHTSLLWSTEFNEYVAFEYGVGVGLGMVLGNLRRTEAYQQAGTNKWTKCNTTTDPGTTRHCGSPPVPDGQDGEHYGVKATKWLDDGGGNSVPNFFPWLALPHLALRIKPVAQFQIRVEAGFNVWGLFYGGSLSYGL